MLMYALMAIGAILYVYGVYRIKRIKPEDADPDFSSRDVKLGVSCAVIGAIVFLCGFIPLLSGLTVYIGYVARMFMRADVKVKLLLGTISIILGMMLIAYIVSHISSRKKPNWCKRLEVSSLCLNCWVALGMILGAEVTFAGVVMTMLAIAK